MALHDFFSSETSNKYPHAKLLLLLLIITTTIIITMINYNNYIK